MSGFITKVNLTNRQAKQYQLSELDLYGITNLGTSFSGLSAGPDPNNSGVTNTLLGTISGTFSGNNTTTNFYFSDTRLNTAIPSLSAITPSTSATTQYTGFNFSSSSATIIDGNTVNLSYSGVSFNLRVTGITTTGINTYTGETSNSNVQILSAGTLDYSGSTTWLKVNGNAEIERNLKANTISATTFYGDGSNLTGISGGTSGNFVNKSGDTMTGTLNLPSLSATTISGGTFYGNGSNLTGITTSNIIPIYTENIGGCQTNLDCGYQLPHYMTIFGNGSKITKLYFYIANSGGSTLFELGLYDSSKNKLASGNITTSSTGLQYITLNTGITTTLGTSYYVAINKETNLAGTTILANTNATSLTSLLFQGYSSSILPNTETGSNASGRNIWIMAN